MGRHPTSQIYVKFIQFHQFLSKSLNEKSSKFHITPAKNLGCLAIGLTFCGSVPVKPNCMRFGIQIDATLHAKVMLNYMQIGQDSSQLLHAL